MLKKLLKHEFRYVWRIWWILAVVMLSLAVGGGLTQGFVKLAEQNSSFESAANLSAILLSLCIICMVCSVFGLFILILVRFYNHMFTDEGYLTFTLPVSRRDVLLSKTINAFIWTIAHTVLLIICIDLISILSDLTTNGEIGASNLITYSIGELFEIGWDAFGGWTIAYAFEIFALMAIGVVFGICLFQLCITIAATVAKKAKLLVAIGVYYLAGIVLSLIGQIILIIAAAITSSGLSTVLANITEMQGYGLLALVLLIGIAAFSTFTLLIYFINRNILERKLNLA